MGNGASAAEVEAHLNKWESAVNDLSALCKSHKRALGGVQGPNASTTSAPGGGGSVFGSSSPAGLTVPTDDCRSPEVERNGDDGPEEGRSMRGRRASSLVSFNAKQKSASPTSGIAINLSNTKPVEFAMDDPNSSAANAALKTPKHNRQQIMDTRRARLGLFKSFVDRPLGEVTGTLACNHFATLAVALTAVLGGSQDSTDRKLRVTVEDIFFAAHVPLHLVQTEGIHLTELHDIVREFIDVDNRFKGEYQVETLHMDIAPTVGQVEIGTNEVGDRQAKVQLPEFRKAITHELDEGSNSVIIINYDPFVLEQDMIIDVDEDEDEDEEPSLPTSARGNDALMASVMNLKGNPNTANASNASGLRFNKKNKGAFAAIVDCRNAVQFMVSLAHAVADDRLHAAIEEVPLNSLFRAMMTHEGGERARGYMRISRKGDTLVAGDSQPDLPNPQSTTSFYSPELCSGKVVGSLVEGTHAHTIHAFFSPHIVAVAWALHLIRGASEQNHNHGQGLPVGDIIRTLHLTSDVYINCDLPLERVYLYTEAYLARKELGAKYVLSYHPVITRVSRENAVPTISVFDLEAILLDVQAANDDPETPSTVMIIQYNPEVAHNVLGIADASQWCILSGYDRENQLATCLDANMKKFCASWTCSLDRLHKAITSHGYLLLCRAGAGLAAKGKSSESSRSSTPSASRSDRPVPTVVQSRVELVKAAHFEEATDVVNSFPFPSHPFAVTIMALALTRLGLHTSIDAVINRSGFHTSAVLDTHFGLEAFLICLRHHLHAVGESKNFEIVTRHYDPNNMPTLDEFVAQVRSALSRGTATQMVVHYAARTLKILGTQQPFGDYGVVCGLQGDTVTLCDVNPSRFNRTWSVTTDELYHAIGHSMHAGRRSRGTITISRRASPAEAPKAPHRRPFSLENVPLQNAFQMSPSPQIQGLSIAFAQLGHFHSPEEIFYEAYLKTVTDQRRRGSQAFAWRDVDVSIAILNRKIDSRMMALVARKFIESRKVTNLTAEALEEVDGDDVPAMLVAACDPEGDHVLMMSYDANSVHQLQGMASSVALVQEYDPAEDRITLLDCEYCLYGERWTCTMKQLIKAADIDNPGSSKYGFVKITRRANEKRAGIGLARAPTTPQTESDKHREKLTTFVGA